MQASVTGWRIRFVSRSATGASIVETGLALRPSSDAPEAGFPLVGWGHQTQGIADACAPSRSESQIGPPLTEILRAGYSVVAPDYEGLGDPERPHPYLDGPSEARSLMDAMRAAGQLEALRATGPAVIWGYSQGGRAALFAAQMSRAYAPELSILGYVAVAPPTTETWVSDSLHDPARLQFGMLAVSSWSETDRSLPLRDVLTPAGVAVARSLRGSNGGSCPDSAGTVSKTDPATLVRSPISSARWQRAFRLHALPSDPPNGPVLIIGGTRDTTVPTSEIDEAERRLCSGGGTATVTTEKLAGDHFFVADPAPVLAWISALRRGEPVANGCSVRGPVGGQ